VTEAALSAFHVIGFEDADELLIKADLTRAILQELQQRGLNQTEAAKALAMPRQELAHLMKGRISRFTIDRLVKAFGQLQPTVRVRVAFEAR
jgi:predicted XRE-type DNA-binding protein